MRNASAAPTPAPEVSKQVFDRDVTIGIGLLVGFLAVAAGLTQWNTRQIRDDVRWVDHTYEVLGLTRSVMLGLVDAETGQRGFLITGKDEYLQPYNAALARLSGFMQGLAVETKDNPTQQVRVRELEGLVALRLSLLKDGIDLRRRNPEAQVARFSTGRGKATMDAIRGLVAVMEREERALLDERERRTNHAYRVATTSALLTALFGFIALGALVVQLRRSSASRLRTASILYQQREWLGTTLASIGDGVIATDMDGRVVFLNPVAQALTGWNEEEATGLPLGAVFQIINEKTREPVDNPALRALQEGRVFGLANHTILVAKTGTERPIDDSAAPIRNQEGGIVGAVLVFRDITDRRKTEEERLWQNEQLAEADRKKNEFLAILAHELRNPLAPILNAVAILRAKGPPVPELTWAREVIHRQTKHMVRLLDDLLDVSRVTRNSLQLRKQRVSLADVLQRAVETSSPLIDAAGHRLISDVPPIPMWLDGDPLRLIQAISNLLNNAAKYTDRGGEISLVAVREGSDVVISVKDTGIGIPPEHLPRVFDIFAQAAPALERSQGGLGIGLSLVRSIVEIHGGSIEARSRGVGHGSEFILRLPIACGPEVAIVDEENIEKPASGFPLRILVSDDNLDALESLSMLLKIMGHEVHLAHDGSEAVATAIAVRPHLILLDIGMPKLNGYDAARQIRAASRGKRVVLAALTGWGQQEDRQRAMDAGFDHHLVKPVDLPAMEKLLHLVHELRERDCIIAGVQLAGE